MDVKDIIKLIEYLDGSSVVELELKNKDTELALRKKEVFGTEITSAGAGPAPVVKESATVVPEAAPALGGEAIEAPIVGTFYRSPSPDSPAFAEEGKTIKAGETLCILEAMKVMNELEAEFDCRILSILVENGEMVEYGTPLFLVERV
jgi:acetyl-CoA carboxylase biotin carboxyl carrier protein